MSLSLTEAWVDTEFIPKTHTGNAELGFTSKSPSCEEGKAGMRRKKGLKKERCAWPSLLWPQIVHFQILSCSTPAHPFAFQSHWALQSMPPSHWKDICVPYRLKFYTFKLQHTHTERTSHSWHPQRREEQHCWALGSESGQWNCLIFNCLSSFQAS